MKTIQKPNLTAYKILSPMEMNSIHFSSDRHSDRPQNSANSNADVVPGTQSGGASSSSSHKKLSEL